MMNRTFPWLAALPSFITPAVALAQQTPGTGYGPYMWNGGWYGWFLGPLMMIVFVIVAVLAVVLLVRWLRASGHAGSPQSPPGKTPLDILNERFARGEIDREEFEERRRVLGE